VLDAAAPIHEPAGNFAMSYDCYLNIEAK